MRKMLPFCACVDIFPAEGSSPEIERAQQFYNRTLRIAPCALYTVR